MSLPHIIALLRETVGLDVESVGVSLIERAVRIRLGVSGLSDISQYAELLPRSPVELQRLVEAIVIPETFFFRYPESFVALRQIIGEKNLLGAGKIRVLSVPCSTGEEPYSIAMTLLEMGLSPDQFQIDAVDISVNLLDLAKLAMFGGNSFRGSELSYRHLYFQKSGPSFHLCDRVNQCINFEQGNVLQRQFRFGSESYDYIFCRNLLIYFHEQAQSQALQNLKQCLTADGLLFVGPAEASALAQHAFHSVKMPMAFAFRKNESLTVQTLTKQKHPKVWPIAKPVRAKTTRVRELAAVKKAIPEIAKEQPRKEFDLAFAEQLADQGQLGEATEICEIFLREKGPSARAFHLLGLICDGAGDQQQASEYYRKALYLEPDHYDALIHLALLKDHNGENAAAKVLKSRARRVLEQSK